MEGENPKPRMGGPLPHVVSFVAGALVLPSALLFVWVLLVDYSGETGKKIGALVVFATIFVLAIVAIVSDRFRRWIAFGVGVLFSPVGFWSLFTGAIAVGLMSDCGHGRPLRIGGRPMPRRVRIGRRFRGAVTDRLLGRLWANDAALEASSVGAFRKLAMQLRAHDASDELVAWAERSAEEEAEHAEGAAALARAYGVDCEPTLDEVPPLDAAELDLGRIAVESLVDGCLGESFSAALATRASEPSHARVGAHLRAIAPDEERHAELAWKVLDFAIERGGEPVRSEVLRAVERIEVQAAPRALPDFFVDRHPTQGRLSRSATHALFDEVRARVVDRAKRTFAA